MDRRGIVLVVSAPSGGGKGTILARVFANDDRLRHAVSATTRKPRDGEVDGQHYHFLTREEFQRRVEENQFAEWAEVHGERYGTLNSELDDILNSEHDAVLELDIQGRRSIAVQRDDVRSIFLLPPSLEVLEERLRKRGDLSPDQLQLRLKNAKEEISAAKEYDYELVNDVLDKAVAAFEVLLRQAREHPEPPAQ